jgi:hypothetical protein
MQDDGVSSATRRDQAERHARILCAGYLLEKSMQFPRDLFKGDAVESCLSLNLPALSAADLAGAISQSLAPTG